MVMMAFKDVVAFVDPIVLPYHTKHNLHVVLGTEAFFTYKTYLSIRHLLIGVFMHYI